MQGVIPLLKSDKKRKINQTTTNQQQSESAKSKSYYFKDDISKVLLLSNNVQKNAILIILLHLLNKDNINLKKKALQISFSFISKSLLIIRILLILYQLTQFDNTQSVLSPSHS